MLVGESRRVMLTLEEGFPTSVLLISGSDHSLAAGAGGEGGHPVHYRMPGSIPTCTH